MNEETQSKTIDIDGVQVPLIIPDGHIVTGAVLMVTTAGMDDLGTSEGFLCTSSAMSQVQLVGMLRTATIEVENGVAYGECDCEERGND